MGRGLDPKLIFLFILLISVPKIQISFPLRRRDHLQLVVFCWSLHITIYICIYSRILRYSLRKEICSGKWRYFPCRDNIKGRQGHVGALVFKKILPTEISHASVLSILAWNQNWWANKAALSCSWEQSPSITRNTRRSTLWNSDHKGH